ncbi:restriction endonuclease [Sediminibacter sp. Hel_I_10]|uniref:restriction endonuclease n=1 Tax=Sediminibacter sp. Hel_I_10 TaxID=1392490 RepID=UPI00047B341A|nr:restriction endonuclease [Sediminibacter sp. Hel_I_10]
MKLDGKSLERATELIETHILNHIQKSEIGEIKVENNKIIFFDGVRNEIDVHITIDLKIGTTLIYIFECKNYSSKKVDKNDIIIFEEKIKLFNAQKGYFVAKKYTKDSVNRASQNEKIKLLELDNENSRIFDKDYFIQIQSAYIENCNINIEVFPAIPFEKEFEFLPIEIPDRKSLSVHDLVLEKLQLGEVRATKYRTLEDLRNQIEINTEFEKVETLHRDSENWQFMITVNRPVLNKIEYIEIRFKVNVDYVFEIPQIIFEYNIKEKGHYAKIRIRGLFKNQYSTMEVTKNELTNEIHFHNIETEQR